METTRLLVGAAMRAPPPSPAPPTPQFRRLRLPHPRGGAHCLPFAGAARPTLLTRCSYSRKGNSNSRAKPRHESSGAVRLDVEESSDQGTNLANDQRKGDIRELFSQAQRNILYLNKQRLLAMEELKKLQDENELLLQEIEVLEMEVQEQNDLRRGFPTPTVFTKKKLYSKMHISSFICLSLNAFHFLTGALSGVPLEAMQSSRFCELLLRIDTMVISGMINMQEASDLREKVVNNRSIIESTFSDIHHKPNTELLSELRLFLRKPIEKPLHVVHICSELDPIASCGSLSTYVAGVSCAVQGKGNLVEVILPKYTSINTDGIHGFRKAEAEYESYFGGIWHKNRIWTG